MSTDEVVKGMSDNIAGTNGNRIRLVSVLVTVILAVLGLTVPPMIALATYNINKLVGELEDIKGRVSDHEVRITKREANAYTIQQAQQERIRIDDRFATGEKLNATINEKLTYIQHDIQELQKTVKEK